MLTAIQPKKDRRQEWIEEIKLILNEPKKLAQWKKEHEDKKVDFEKLVH